MSFGPRLREERLAQKLKLRDLEKLSGVPRSTIWDVEQGKVEVRVPVAVAIAGALGLALADLEMAGPRLFEVEFNLRECAPGPERSVLSMVPGPMLARVAVWPWAGDGRLRLRARASCLPSLIGLAGGRLPGARSILPAPTVRPVGPSSELMVLVRAPGLAAARREVLAEATKADCCPPVEVTSRGPLWLARLRGVPERCSIVLQRLAPESPIGLFVPG